MNTKKSSLNSTHYHHLKKKWTEKHHQRKKNLWEKHKDSLDWILNKFPSKHDIAASSLGSILFLSSPVMVGVPTGSANPLTHQEVPIAVDKEAFLISELSTLLPKNVIPLTSQEEEATAAVLHKYYGIPVAAELSGLRLNRSYGYIGKEQHLMRYPGDTIDIHFETIDDANKFSKDGMAPGRGAWGYFVPSKAELTQKDIEREKYYIAVQTFLAPDFMHKVGVYRDFFKYRKMVVVNPQNGRAMVVVVGDAGPAEWTGKHLGGSPEVMNYLERVDGRQKGPVLYFFVDDPGDTIPLGPRQLL